MYSNLAQNRIFAAGILRSRLVLAVLLAGIVTMVGAQPVPSPALLDLARVPLIVNAALPPNLLVTVDDSGSMAFGFTPDSLQTNCSWRHPRYYTAQFNTQYFDPTVTYVLPKRADGTSFPNANFTSASQDGFLAGAPTYNLSTGYRVTASMAHGGPWITYGNLTTTATTPLGPTCNDNYNSTNNKTVRFPYGQAAFYYDFTPNAAYSSGSPNDARNYTPRQVSVAQRQNFANWFAYYRTRILTARSALTLAFDDMNPSNRVAWQNYHANQIGATTEIKALSATDGTFSDWKGRFYNWIHNSPAVGATPMRASLARGGEFFTRGSSTQMNSRNPYFDPAYGRELSCRQNFHIMMTDGYWNGAISSAVGAIGDYDGSNQTLPDGTAYTTTGPASRVYWNSASGGTAAPNLADIAFYYWANDLRPDLTNDVPRNISDSRTGVVAGAGANEVYFNPANDPGNWQRIVSYFIGFGLSGTLQYDTSNACINNPSLNVPNLCQSARLLRLRRGLDQWPAAQSGQPNTLDDAWRAAVNSRGQFLSAENPSQLVESLSAVLDNVSRRQGSSGSSGSSVFQRAGEYQYRASYDSGEWIGDIDATTSGSSPPWPNTAASQLNDRPFGSRNVFTWRPGGASPSAGTRVGFAWNSLSVEQRNALNFNAETGAADTLGAARVQYIHGDRTQETANGGPFRTRASVFGAVVGSNIRYVEQPAQGYSGRIGFVEGGRQYAEFRETHRQRAPTLYVGANDGMLHAFNGRTGHEVWAFVPNAVIPKLPYLTTEQFQFVPTVDGRISTHDVYIGGSYPNGEWRTVIFGTLGLGGQAVYALDVTDPASPRVLWELSDEHEPLLGYNYGEVRVTRLYNRRWVALIPTGYNNQTQLDYATRGLPHPLEDANRASGEALLVVDVETGNVLHRLSSFPGSGVPHGLAQVTVGEYQNNFVADFAVGGDLNGNLWRFDLSEDNFGEIQHVFAGSSARPITSAPRIFPNQGQGMMFTFGTGKFLELSDREISASDARQTMYGIRECRQCAPATEAQLIEQTFVQGNDGFVGLNQTLVVPPERRGWFARLGNTSFYGGALTGERIVSTPDAIFPMGAIIFRSYIPSDDPCTPQGGTVIYILSAYTGGYVFPGELNNNGTAFAPGQSPWPTGSNTDIGAIYVPGVTRPPPGDDGGGGCDPDVDPDCDCTGNSCDPVDPDPGGSLRIDANGCLLVGGLVTNACITPRRRGWREVGLQ